VTGCSELGPIPVAGWPGIAVLGWGLATLVSPVIRVLLGKKYV